MDPKEMELKLQQLEKQCDDLKKEVEDFEFWRKVARLLGLSLGGILIFLVSQYRAVDSFRQQIEEVAKQSGPLATALSSLQTREGTLELEESTLEGQLADAKREVANLGKRTTEAAIEKRVKDFNDTPLDPSRAQDAFRAQLKQLTDYGLEYIAYVGESPSADDDGRLFTDLTKAAALLEDKGKKQPQVQPAWVNDAHQFSDILNNFHNNSKHLSSTDRSLCYEEELPVWLQRTGIVTINDAKKMAEKSPRCQCLLHEPDDSKYQSGSECKEFLAGNTGS